MFKYKIFLIIIALSYSISGMGQHDPKAKEILDKVASTYTSSKGMLIQFKGTQVGTLWIKDERFVLDCGGVKSWFDGQTQWSYVKDNEEVTITTPTPEEIQVVNPYVLITMYQKGFNYRFGGKKTIRGIQGDEISLIPDNQQDIRKIILLIGKNFVPTYIGVDMQNGHYEEFIISNVENTELQDTFFQFEEKKYPEAEIIDLR